MRTFVWNRIKLFVNIKINVIHIPIYNKYSRLLFDFYCHFNRFCWLNSFGSLNICFCINTIVICPMEKTRNRRNSFSNHTSLSKSDFDDISVIDILYNHLLYCYTLKDSSVNEKLLSPSKFRSIFNLKLSSQSYRFNMGFMFRCHWIWFLKRERIIDYLLLCLYVTVPYRTINCINVFLYF